MFSAFDIQRKKKRTKLKTGTQKINVIRAREIHRPPRTDGQTKMKKKHTKNSSHTHKFISIYIGIFP